MKKSLIALASIAVALSASIAHAGLLKGGTTVNAPVANASANQAQGQIQGQIQGQLQGQVAVGGNSTAAGGASNANANNTNTVSNSVNVAAQERNPVSGASAPGLTSANGSCMGSTSIGGQGVGFGFSVGGTWTDGDCDRRYDSIRLQELGFKSAAALMMCGKASVATAMKEAGTPCPEPVKAADVAAKSPVVKPGSCGYTGKDPIVMGRLGC